MRMILSALALMGALAAGAAATGSSGSPHKAGTNQDGGFGRGYGVFHSYGWARGVAGYGQGACYWRPELCRKDDN
jgi:hypothetical protein